MKNLKHTNGIRIALFATFLLLCELNLSAQYKLEFEWRKDMERIVSMTKSDNDSLLYVAFENLISTYKTSDGSLSKSDSVEANYNLLMSRDGKTLVASSGGGVGILEPITFKQIFWDYTLGSNYLSLNLNEMQNKFVICGTSGFIKVYDVNSKSLFKEFKPSDVRIKNAKLSGDGKYIVYSYIIEKSKPYELHNYLKVIDMEGKLVKDFGETSSNNFTLAYDDKTLIYFMSDAIHFFDIESMKETDEIQLDGLNPERIELSSDGKSMLLGFNEISKITNSLLYFDLTTKKYSILNDNSSWGEPFKLNKDNSSLFYGINNHLYKFKLTPNTSISYDQNKLEWTIQVKENILLLTKQNYINTNLEFRIVGLNGKVQKQILPNEIQFNTNFVTINITSLLSGFYFIEVVENQKVVFSSKFNKIN